MSKKITSPNAGVAVFQPVEQPRLYVSVARQIAQQIRDIPLHPGTQLPSERDLAAQFQVSRTTLREAMIALETMDMIEVRVGDGNLCTRWRRKTFQHSLGPGGGSRSGSTRAVQGQGARGMRGCGGCGREYLRQTNCAGLKTLSRRWRQTSMGQTLRITAPPFPRGVAAASRNSILVSLIAQLWEMRGSAMWRTMRDRVVRPQHHWEALTDRRAILRSLQERNGVGAFVGDGSTYGTDPV